MRLTHITSEKLFEKGFRLASLYGFLPVDKIFDEYRRVKRKKVATPPAPQDKQLQHLSQLLRFYIEKDIKSGEEPLFVFHSNIDAKMKRLFTSSKKTDDAYFTLSIIGAQGPYAEALLLSCAHHIFSELKSKKTLIRLNSMGTAKDAKDYFSNLNKTLRKCKNNISTECARLLNKSMMVEAHPLLYSEDHTGVYEHLVPSLRNLSNTGNAYFEQLIEYVENQGMVYEFAQELIQMPKHGNHSVFEMCSEDTTLQASGGCYDALSKTLYKREIPVSSLTITLTEKTAGCAVKPKKTRRPKIFFFHSGEKARMRSLALLAKFAYMNIPVDHRLHCRRVDEQLSEKRHLYQYIAVYGQEEADNETVCLRNTDTREYEIVSIQDEGLKQILTLL